ncbi:glycosyltransferase [Candidatus Roizmanbacteria bacterium]|nr:glycosyltransferase [Candidatus Roizmanbacteria bacterium]
MSGLVALGLQNLYEKKIPLVTTFHTLALMKNLVARDENERETEKRIDTETELIKRSNIITASSRTDREYLISLYDCPRTKVEVITPGVDTNLFHRIDKRDAAMHLNENPSQKIIMFVGRIEPLKGIDVLMYALKIYLKRNPNSELKLMIIGGSSHERTTNYELERLKELQHTLRIHPAVEFIPQQSQSALPYYYNYADIVVMPSHYESFGMTTLEAMACGTSIIATDTSGVSSIFDRELKNLTISANNPLLLANQIESVLNKPKKHKILQEKVMRKAQAMNWENVAKKLLTIYKIIT